MKPKVCLALSAVLLLPLGARSQVFAPAGAPAVTRPTATPTPLPKPPAPPVQGAAFGAAGTSVKQILNTPAHSPHQLQFGEVWDGQSSMKAFSLTTTAAGYVRVEIPSGPFYVAEIRELGPMKSGSKNMGGPVQVTMSRETKGKVAFKEGQSGPSTYGASAGNDVVIQVVFKPHFKFGSMMAGQKTATMKVGGPGPSGPWTLSVPLQGMFDGIRIAGSVVPDRELIAVAGLGSYELAVSVAATNTPLKGTLRGGTLPAGFAITPTGVAVGPGTQSKIKVPVSFDWSRFPKDGNARPAELFLDYGGGTLKVSFDVVGLPESVHSDLPSNLNCGVNRLGAEVSLHSNGRVRMSMSAQNQDFINNRTVYAVVSIAGRRVARGKLYLPLNALGGTTTDYHLWDTNDAIHLFNFDYRFSASDYRSAVNGPVTWGCGLEGSPQTQF